MKIVAEPSRGSTGSQVRPADVCEAEQVFATLTLAFAADPPNRWLYPNENDYLSQFPTFVNALGGRAFRRGTAFLTADYSGASLWLAPDTSPDEEALAQLARTLAPDKSTDMGTIIEEMGRYHPNEPHWYLPFIGVVPTRQNQGLGAVLLRRGLAECDAKGLPAYLESTNPRNRTLYERYGFEPIGEIRVGSCPPIVPMLRKAR
jgi:GNAT superfamily N-acetyltransferase